MTGAARADVATDLIVFGRGLRRDGSDEDRDGGGIRLTDAALDRVAAAHRYVTDHAADFSRRDGEGVRGRIVFSGGWPGAAAGMEAPPPEHREGVLMRDHFTELGTVPPVDLLTETRSDSTLENALCVLEGGYFTDRSFGPDHRLGLVGHRGHLERIDYFVRKVLHLPAEAVVHIPASGPDTFAPVPEGQALRMARIACFGARSPTALRRRHRWLVTAGRLTGGPRGFGSFQARMRRRRHPEQSAAASQALPARRE